MEPKIKRRIADNPASWGEWHEPGAKDDPATPDGDGIVGTGVLGFGVLGDNKLDKVQAARYDEAMEQTNKYAPNGEISGGMMSAPKPLTGTEIQILARQDQLTVDSWIMWTDLSCSNRIVRKNSIYAGAVDGALRLDVWLTHPERCFRTEISETASPAIVASKLRELADRIDRAK